MSRGLGKVQREILKYLKNHGGEAEVKDIVIGIFDNALYYDGYNDSKYSSICRAIRSLEKRGLVKTYKFSTAQVEHYVKNPEHWKYIPTWIKFVQLTDEPRKPIHWMNKHVWKIQKELSVKSLQK